MDFTHLHQNPKKTTWKFVSRNCRSMSQGLDNYYLQRPMQLELAEDPREESLAAEVATGEFRLPNQLLPDILNNHFF